MSLSSIKAKEVKGKQNVLPKLKTILANPKKTYCPRLTSDELGEFQSLLCNAINRSGQGPRAYATSAHIRLGLESCLRAINNRQSSCVYVSVSIRPHFLVNLIARNVEVKDESVPVYVQPQLEQFISEVFGIKALAMVLPAETANLGEELDRWLTARKKLKKVGKTEIFSQPTAKKKYKAKVKKQEEKSETSNEIVMESAEPKHEKSLSGDYISFSNSGADKVNLDNLHLEDDKNLLLGALSKMSVPVEEASTSECVEMDVAESENDPNTAPTAISSDSDNFLEECEYHPLTVHKVCKNPNKKLKKRRKTKKK